MIFFVEDFVCPSNDSFEKDKKIDVGTGTRQQRQGVF